MTNKSDKPVSETSPKSSRSKFCDATDGIVPAAQAAVNDEIRHPKAPIVDATDWEHGFGLN